MITLQNIKCNYNNSNIKINKILIRIIITRVMKHKILLLILVSILKDKKIYNEFIII